MKKIAVVTRLHIIAIDIKKYAATIILNRLCLYENAICN